MLRIYPASLLMHSHTMKLGACDVGRTAIRISAYFT
jgi:hypothetical protein